MLYNEPTPPHCTCNALVLYLNCTATAHVQHMYCTCTAHVLHMCSTCTAHVLHIYCTYTAHVMHIYFTCTAYVLHMYRTCTADVLHCTLSCTLHSTSSCSVFRVLRESFKSHLKAHVSKTSRHLREKLPSLLRIILRTRIRICCKNFHPKKSTDPLRIYPE